MLQERRSMLQERRSMLQERRSRLEERRSRLQERRSRLQEQRSMLQERPFASAKAMPRLWTTVQQLRRLQSLCTYVHTKNRYNSFGGEPDSTCIRRGGVVD